MPCSITNFRFREKSPSRPQKSSPIKRDLSLAYSPGVAYACTAIHKDPNLAALYTARANLVAVVTNGSAVLGLGNIGGLAGKPVMEGKGCLFKKFAGIDVFDIEVSEADPDKFVEVIAALEPTFGGINLRGERKRTGVLASGAGREGRASGRVYNAPTFQGCGGLMRPEMVRSCAVSIVDALQPELFPARSQRRGCAVT
jgi:hypothetical protein